ncbi:hypothetical protein chiPu_0003757 [Chiloscyllium punctatum]|uniref:Uncharacterized protein n=1 Tax=Chiloscyllium punctatum TaxID=137246 RepID=A0A401S4M5_CHIPU|nr:hypothetical protein [Chiloscyllium punctatum]
MTDSKCTFTQGTDSKRSAIVSKRLEENSHKISEKVIILKIDIFIGSWSGCARIGRTTFLFSAFKQNRDVNSSDWDAKLLFWGPVLLREAARRQRLTLTAREGDSWFRRKGAVPLGLDTVLHDLAR